jgi:hypothetical protein
MLARHEVTLVGRSMLQRGNTSEKREFPIVEYGQAV